VTPVCVGVDYGRKRIGLAVSTPLGTVHPRPRLLRTTLERDLAAIRSLVEETDAGLLVVGLPHHMDGTTSEMELEARAFARALAAACGRPVFGLDERLTSEAASSALAAPRGFGKAQKERRDSAAACIVLQDYLNDQGQAERIA
jgi:putative Holliday junction resolvase